MTTLQHTVNLEVTKEWEEIPNSTSAALPIKEFENTYPASVIYLSKQTSCCELYSNTSIISIIDRQIPSIMVFIMDLSLPE